MKPDDQTLRDLEVLTDSRGGAGLFGLVDRTRTRLGRQVLMSRLGEPLVDARDILAAQHDLAFLRRQAVAFPIDDELLHAVHRYTRSNIEAATTGRLDADIAALWTTARHPDIHRELSRGVASASIFVRRFREYCAGMLALTPGGVLATFLGGVVATALELEAGGLGRGASMTVPAVFRLDAVLRGRCRDQLRRLVDAAAELDALCSMAAFGVEQGYCVAELSPEQPQFDIEGLTHPLVQDPVANDLCLDGPTHVVFLTGPNMAGKTTFLKAVGLAQLLAQTGMLVPARRFRFSPVDMLFTGMNTADDLSGGVSYYLAEVRRVKQIAAELAAGSRALVLIDEAFKGTNVVDATDATRLVIEACVGISDSIFLFASHLVELAPVLAEHGVALRSFAGEIQDGLATYGFRIREGVSDQRMGLLLLRQEGVLELLNEAIERRVGDVAN